MKVLIAADKFKGSLSAMEVCESIRSGILEVVPKAKTSLIPLADGGEGTLNILEDVLDLEVIKVHVQDPLFRNIEASYGLKGEHAFVEMARASGFELLTDDERSAMNTSSIGTGHLIQDAIERGAKYIHLFVGGSATNDGGVGMASALGYRFLNYKGEVVVPIGKNLSEIKNVQTDGTSPDIRITLITDVRNSLLGPEGASYQYGTQKGATDEEIEHLEQGLKHLSNLVSEITGRDIANVPGSGAAGGMGLSVLGLMNGKLQNGIGTVLNLVAFDDALRDADLVITGEGRIDQQTLQGKVVHGVTQAASRLQVPVSVLCGVNKLELQDIKELGIKDLASLKTDALSVEHCMLNASSLTKQRAKELMTRFLRH